MWSGEEQGFRRGGKKQGKRKAYKKSKSKTKIYKKGKENTEMNPKKYRNALWGLRMYRTPCVTGMLGQGRALFF